MRGRETSAPLLAGHLQDFAERNDLPVSVPPPLFAAVAREEVELDVFRQPMLDLDHICCAALRTVHHDLPISQPSMLLAIRARTTNPGISDHQYLLRLETCDLRLRAYSSSSLPTYRERRLPSSVQ